MFESVKRFGLEARYDGSPVKGRNIGFLQINMQAVAYPLRKDRRLGQSADAKTLSWSEARDRILEDSIFPKIVGEEWRVPLNWIHETDPLPINPILRAPF